MRAVAFDLDDTLAVPDRDRAELLEEAVRAASEAADADGAVAEDVSRADYVDAHTRVAESENREPIFADLLAGRGADPAVAATVYREAVGDAIVPADDADRLLASLRGRYRLGLLTDGPSRAQREKLDRLGWADVFDAVVVTGELETRKPDPAAFDALVTALDVPAAETVYVGDRPDRDVHGAADAGLRTVQVLGPGETADPRADASVRRAALADELPAALASL